jgi:hypothetical protein
MKNNSTSMFTRDARASFEETAPSLSELDQDLATVASSRREFRGTGHRARRSEASVTGRLNWPVLILDIAPEAPPSAALPGRRPR